MYGRDETGPVTCGTVQPLVTTIADRVRAIRSDVPGDGPNADPSDPVNLDTCLRAVAARRENLGGDGHRRTFIRSTPAERSEGEGGRTLWPVELRCGCRRGWGTRAVAEGAKS